MKTSNVPEFLSLQLTTESGSALSLPRNNYEATLLQLHLVWNPRLQRAVKTRSQCWVFECIVRFKKYLIIMYVLFHTWLSQVWEPIFIYSYAISIFYMSFWQ